MQFNQSILIRTKTTTCLVRWKIKISKEKDFRGTAIHFPQSPKVKGSNFKSNYKIRQTRFRLLKKRKVLLKKVPIAATSISLTCPLIFFFIFFFLSHHFFKLYPWNSSLYKAPPVLLSSYQFNSSLSLQIISLLPNSFVSKSISSILRKQIHIY